MADTKISALTSATTPLAGTEVLPVVQSGTTKQVSVANLTAGRAVTALSLNASGGTLSAGGTANGTFRLDRSDGATNLGYITWVTSGDEMKYVNNNGGFHGFYVGATKYLTVNEGGLGGTIFYSGNLIQGTAAKGINFTANSAAAGKTSQLLNWYEEGTFTPTITGATTAGTGTYTNQIGRYTRIGRAVHFTIYVTWTAHTGTGTILVGDLPFASNSTAGQYYQYAAASDSLTYGANATLQLLLFSNQTKMTCYAQSNGAALAGVNIDTQADLIVTGTYFV